MHISKKSCNFASKIVETENMWYYIWIIVKLLFGVSFVGYLYYLMFRIAILGRGFFVPDMRKVDDHFGLYESWNSAWGYLAYYSFILFLIIIPIAIIVVWNLV